MNLLTLQQEIGRLLNDPNNTRWTGDVLTARINLAQTEIQGYTDAVKTSETVTPVANTATVSLNANTMDIVRASKTQVNGSVIPFDGITREELDIRFPGWQQWTAGEPMYWYYDATNQQVTLAPKPDSSNAITNGLTFWEVRVPTDLSSSTDVPFLSNNQMIPYHMAIVHWVVAQCWMDDGQPEALSKAKFHKSGSLRSPGQYELQIERIMSLFDVPAAIPSHINWMPEGGRVGTFGPSKAYPLL